MTSTPLEMALEQYDEAVRHFSVKRGIEEYLRKPKRELTVNSPSGTRRKGCGPPGATRCS